MNILDTEILFTLLLLQTKVGKVELYVCSNLRYEMITTVVHSGNAAWIARSNIEK